MGASDLRVTRRYTFTPATSDDIAYIFYAILFTSCYRCGFSLSGIHLNVATVNMVVQIVMDARSDINTAR